MSAERGRVFEITMTRRWYQIVDEYEYIYAYGIIRLSFDILSLHSSAVISSIYRMSKISPYLKQWVT